MARTNRGVAAAALVLGALVVPSASADDTEWTSFACNFALVGDSTGTVTGDPAEFFGYIDGGPTFAHDYADDESAGPAHLGADGLTSITQHCWLQVSDHLARHSPDAAPPIPEAHCDFTSPGPAVMPYQACAVSLRVDPEWAEVYVCTWWEFDHGGHHEDWLYDSGNSLTDDGTAVRYPPPADNPVECYIALS